MNLSPSPERQLKPLSAFTLVSTYHYLGQIKVLWEQQAIIQIFRKWQLSEQGILAVYYYCQVNHNAAILMDPTRYLLEPLPLSSHLSVPLLLPLELVLTITFAFALTFKIEQALALALAQPKPQINCETRQGAISIGKPCGLEPKLLLPSILLDRSRLIALV